MPNCVVEARGKCYYLFYLKADGVVVGLGSGGGAGYDLTGDDFLVWRYNREDAPDVYGCIPWYYNPIGRGKALTVNLALVGAFEDASRAWKVASDAGDAEATHAAFETMSDCRDACVTFRAIPTKAEGE